MPRWLKITGIGCGGLLILGALFIVGLVALVALVPTDTTGSGQGTGGNREGQNGQSENSGETFTTENYGQLFADPDAYSDAEVDVTGQLFVPPEREGGELAFQIWVDPENAEWNTVVYSENSDLELKSDDYVRVKGSVLGSLSGENAFGGDVDAPTIEARDVEVIDAAEAIDPAQKSIDVGQTREDQGFSITLNRVEFGENSTRAYVTARNGTNSTASFYTFDARIVQGSSQVDVSEDLYVYDLQEPQEDLAPGVQTEGVVVFGRVDASQPFNVRFEWLSENFNITPKPLMFTVTP
ncbi:MAG: hypothetical protein ACFB50_10245 [Rubrobacteraceae bacterium]